jgi:receptor protein-tyrosine kinase/non-specific protein-tyrosine kinase
MSRIEKSLEKAIKLRGKGSRKEETENLKAEKSIPVSYKIASDEAVAIDNPYIVAMNGSNSAIAEEYRKLKSIIVKLTKSAHFQNTMMVTSTIGREGKSITSLNLAITLAQEYDHTVLLIDADLRQPTLHKHLNIPNKMGLSDCLTNGTDISKVMVKTGIGKLVVIPSGRHVSNPAELIASTKMKQIVKELKHRYSDRYIIIDTPPILPFAEAHSIGSVVDGVIFIVREGHVPVNHFKDAINLLKDFNILGIVYNDAEIDRHSSYYYYSHYYKESDGKEKTKNA